MLLERKGISTEKVLTFLRRGGVQPFRELKINQKYPKYLNLLARRGSRGLQIAITTLEKVISWLMGRHWPSRPISLYACDLPVCQVLLTTCIQNLFLFQHIKLILYSSMPNS